MSGGTKKNIKKLFAAISVLVVLFGVTGADATIVELPLDCAGRYDRNAPSWQTDFDLGIAFTEISNVYIDWSGEITAGLAIDYMRPGPQPFPLDVGLLASLRMNPGARIVTVMGGETTYPEPEGFDFRIEFELLDPTTWSDLLDGQGTIVIDYAELVSGTGSYVKSGSVVLSEAALIVEGTPVPEPATALLLVLGIIGVRASRRRS